jgi:hypothetical protein
MASVSPPTGGTGFEQFERAVASAHYGGLGLGSGLRNRSWTHGGTIGV